MLTFLRRDLAWMLLALSLSAALWFVVTLQQNPDMPISFSGVPIRVNNVPEGLTLATELQTVRVSVTAPQDVGRQLRSDQMRVEVDASRLGDGVHEVPLSVTVLDNRVRFDSVEPASVVLRLDRVESKEVPVRVNQTGSVEFGYVALAPRVTPSTVVVSGPQSSIDQVAAAVVEVNLDGQRVSVSQAVEAFAVSSSGSRVAGVTVQPERVLVEIAIDQQVAYKTVPVTARTVGTVGFGYQMVNVQVDPVTVIVVGDPTVLNRLEYLETRPIDLSGAEGDIAVSTDVNLPNGVSLVYSQNIVVRVLIRPVESSRVMEIAPRVDGLDPTLAAKFDVPSVQVTVAGPLPVLAQLKPEAISVVVDGTTLVPGTHTVMPDVRVPDLLRLVSTSPREMHVTITRTEAAPADSTVQTRGP